LFFVVCFNNEVRLLGDGSQEVVVVSGDKLEDYDTLLEIGKKFAVQKPIRESKETLIKKLFELEETGTQLLKKHSFHFFKHFHFYVHMNFVYFCVEKDQQHWVLRLLYPSVWLSTVKHQEPNW
jgi:hypothetical protein